MKRRLPNWLRDGRIDPGSWCLGPLVPFQLLRRLCHSKWLRCDRKPDRTLLTARPLSCEATLVDNSHCSCQAGLPEGEGGGGKLHQGLFAPPPILVSAPQLWLPFLLRARCPRRLDDTLYLPEGLPGEAPRMVPAHMEGYCRNHLHRSDSLLRHWQELVLTSHF